MSDAVGLALYAGSFDPPTYGHLDLVERASQAVPAGDRRRRHPPAARAALHGRGAPRAADEICAPFANVDVADVRGPARRLRQERRRARHRARSARGTDFEYELQIAHANADLRPEIDTVFLPTRTNYGFISASLVREIASHGGDVSRYAPPEVCDALKKKRRAKNASRNAASACRVSRRWGQHAQIQTYLLR